MKAFFAAGLIFLSAAAFAAEELRGMVLPVLLNVRIAPAMDSPVTATLEKNESIRIYSNRNGWMETDLPASAEVWVAGCFFQKDGMLAEDVIFRSGPSAGTAPYSGVVSGKESHPAVRSTASDGFWKRIKPPAGLRGYVRSDFIELPSAGKSDAAGAEEENDTPSMACPAAMEGRLLALKTPVRGATHELVLEVNGQSIPVAYVSADNLNLPLWENRVVRVDGQSRWHKTVRRPFLEAERISPLWN